MPALCRIDKIVSRLSEYFHNFIDYECHYCILFGECEQYQKNILLNKKKITINSGEAVCHQLSITFYAPKAILCNGLWLLYSHLKSNMQKVEKSK